MLAKITQSDHRTTAYGGSNSSRQSRPVKPLCIVVALPVHTFASFSFAFSCSSGISNPQDSSSSNQPVINSPEKRTPKVKVRNVVVVWCKCVLCASSVVSPFNGLDINRVVQKIVFFYLCRVLLWFTENSGATILGQHRKGDAEPTPGKKKK